MKRILITILCGLTFSCWAGESGMIRVESNHDVATTADKLEAVLKEKGMNVFARIDHAQGAINAGLTLRPTELIIFGNPKVGTPLMHCAQTVAIDLPQKALIFADENNKTWLVYNQPDYLNQRHQLEECRAVLEKISAALAMFASAATQ